MKALRVRLSGQASQFGTTQRRLDDIAEFLGVSREEAAAYAINEAWKRLDEERDMQAELAFRRHGKKVGGITYLDADDGFIRRVEQRIAKGVPLPHEDDEELENDLLFLFLAKHEQAAIRAASDPMEKRRLKAKFLKETKPDEAAGNIVSA